MKRLILFELMLLFLATTFESDSPPGWFQQTIPIDNKTITDIQFIDTSNGWVVTDWGPSFDTAYIFKTSDGGSNWELQYRYPVSFTAINMVNANTGYASGGTGFGRLFKTTNGGTNWNLFFTAGHLFNDLFFVNENTGWICDDDATFGVGVLKTTNGGINWQSQLGASFKPTKLFFLNKDTGWVGTNEPNGRLFRTTNSGVNWDLQYTTNIAITSIFFLNSSNGWIRGGNTVGAMYSTNGGFNWTNAQGNVASGYDIKFVNDSIGYSGGGLQKVAKSTDGGKNWGYQNIPIFDASQTFMFRNDTSLGWMGSNGLIKTTDGGGSITFTGIQQISDNVPSEYRLFQNYPNPFNPVTNIVYSIMSNVKGKMSKVVISLYDITGREITKLIDKEQNAGTYKVDWNAGSLPSGIYFYSLIIDGNTIDTKKMVMIK